MSNPTTPFSWQMPTATDLVTDLPADFEVFGQAVATSMADLLGGTSGQILAKNSNTDMDFVWIANDQGDITAVTAGTGISGGGTSGAVTITNDMATTITASGDIVVGTGSGTYDNLPIGTTGQILTADTSVSPYKVKWATPAGGGGKVLQVVSATTTSGTSIATTTMTDTTITATITPTSATSQILILISVCARGQCSSGTNHVAARLQRNGSTIADYGGGSSVARFLRSNTTDWLGMLSVTDYDAPASTSALTYKLQAAVENTANSMTAEFQLSSTPSTITLLEIGA